MANFKYFAELNGETVSFPQKSVSFNGRGPGHWGFHAETETWIKIDRVIEYKQFASKHECDDRCMHATGKVMRCECACGGKNHGKGSIRQVSREVTF
jgi:hypothetical protein